MPDIKRIADYFGVTLKKEAEWQTMYMSLTDLGKLMGFPAPNGRCCRKDRSENWREEAKP